jgi:arginase
MPRIAVVEAPCALGHVAEHRGVEGAPGRLLRAGITAGLDADHAARVEAPGYNAERDPGTGFMNPAALIAYAPRLADVVGDALDRGEFPLVLGGDCSILLGTMLALRRRGRYGLLYIDGDADFYQAEVNPIGGAASASDLALATGHGPVALTGIEDAAPLVRPEDVVVFANRDRVDRERRGCQPLPEEITELDRDFVGERGPAAAAREAVALLGDLDGFWIHLDADVFDESVMRAVDDPRPGGLGWQEAAEALTAALASGRATGLQVTIYNPDFDRDGSEGRALAGTLNRVLRDFSSRDGPES